MEDKRVCANCENEYREHKNLGYDHFEPYRCKENNGKECSNIWGTTCDKFKYKQNKMQGENMEIERKWLINSIDIESLSIEKEYKIEQAYLFVDKNIEIRIRKKNDKYFLTQKSDGDLVREEFETPINENIYLFLMKNKIGNIINKSRYVIPYNDVKIELDVFTNGLIIAEIEFTTVKKANDFIPPTWFGEEVTNDKKYKNKSLACV